MVLGFKEHYVRDVISYNHERLKTLSEDQKLEFIE